MGWLRASMVSVLLYCGALVSANAWAQSAAPHGDAVRGKALSYTCLGCHGIDGYRNAYPNYEVPEVGGQRADYIVAALQEYRSGQRDHTTMHAQASLLSDQDMADIAAFFTGLKPTIASAAKANTPPAAAAVCVACHGANGVGVVPQYPDLAGQHPDYLVRALQEYRSGARKNPIMAGMAAQLKESDLYVIADYYSRLPKKVETLPRPFIER